MNHKHFISKKHQEEEGFGMHKRDFKS